MRENQRVARQYKQQEQSRIAKLVSPVFRRMESKLSSAAHQPEGLAESFDPRIQAEKEALSPRTPLPHHPPLHPCRCKVAARSSRPSALLVKPKLPNEKRICFPLHLWP